MEPTVIVLISIMIALATIAIGYMLYVWIYFKKVKKQVQEGTYVSRKSKKAIKEGKMTLEDALKLNKSDNSSEESQNKDILNHKQIYDDKNQDYQNLGEK